MTKKTKTALVRVCKQWRAWATDLLYEDVFMRHPERLRPALEDTSDECGCGRWIHWASLPYSSSATVSPHPLEALKVLERCPSLKVLVRKGPEANRRDVDMHFEFTTDCAALPSLKRVDWWHGYPAGCTPYTAPSHLFRYQ
ncbi:hypothetical protein FOMPIDRAFT_1013754 [Fomitopsis schrenkii]|uniref:F-box domain-containing protein n=1 Tax=Fomitopsis schrenkii TaxID=2126942 RepID=S8FUR5_FOMSC|nr:hypothetical protein FOMPIDRAFT_1013754 [Fomitopsis schrenkii]